MAIRRMFSLQIADTDSFLDLSQGAQNLYFHLGMRADDDGFIAGPKKVARMVGSNSSDFDELVADRFLLDFKSGVCLLKHWRVHNTIRKDRYTQTQWVKELKMVGIDEETGKYQLLSEHPEASGIPSGNQMATKRQPLGNHLATEVRLGKDRIGKVSKNTTAKAVGLTKKKTKPTIDTVDKSPEEIKEEKDISEVINQFDVLGVNAGASKFYGQKVQREACRLLLRKFGIELVLKVIALLPKTNSLPAYECPSVTTPNQLLEKWHLLDAKLSAKKHQTSKPKAV
jgi:hypothetical protein